MTKLADLDKTSIEHVLCRENFISVAHISVDTKISQAEKLDEDQFNFRITTFITLATTTTTRNRHSFTNLVARLFVVSQALLLMTTQ